MIDELLSANGLDNEDLHLFRAALRPHALKKNEQFISLGQRCRNLALIEDGYLRTYHLDEDGHEVTTDFNQPNTFCGSYYSFYAQEPSFEIIEAMTDCELYLISYDALQKLYAQSLLINVIGRTVLEKACIERDLRFKKIVHLPAKEKYEWFLEKYAEVYKVAKLGHIASFLGINQETLSRVRRSFIS
jgi:CRP-like cAMP-binding protein